MRKFLLSLALAFTVTAAHAAGVQWSNIVGGFPTWYGSPTFLSNAYTLSAPLPSSPPWSLVTQQHLRIVIPSGGTNTAAATLNVASTGALPIVTNPGSGGPTLLVGGELVAGREYDLTYSTISGGTLDPNTACAGSCYVLSWVADGPVLAGTSQTVSAAQWVSWSVFRVTAASQTLTLPASSGLSPNGGILIQTVGQTATLQASGSDTINGGAGGGSLVLASNAASFVTTSGSGAFYANPTGVAYLNQADQTVSGGANVTSFTLGTQSSGTLTIDCGKAPLQYVTDNGAFTLAAPSNDGSCLVLVTNGASAGAITFSGFSEGSNTGDALNTVNTNKFTLDIWRINGTAGYRVAAHQ